MRHNHLKIRVFFSFLFLLFFFFLFFSISLRVIAQGVILSNLLIGIHLRIRQRNVLAWKQHMFFLVLCCFFMLALGALKIYCLISSFRLIDLYIFNIFNNYTLLILEMHKQMWILRPLFEILVSVSISVVGFWYGNRQYWLFCFVNGNIMVILDHIGSMSIGSTWAIFQASIKTLKLFF